MIYTCQRCMTQKPRIGFYNTATGRDKICCDCRIVMEIRDRNESKQYRHRQRWAEMKAMKARAK